MSSTLILGARGTVGSALVGELRAAGQAVLKATHQAPQAADEVHLNLLTGEGVDAAFDRADRAFLLVPPGHMNPQQLLAAPIEAARRRGVRKVVLMTAMGANADPSIPLRQAELLLERSGVPFNIVRPNWFMQNFHTYWLHGIRTLGRIQLPVGPAKGSFIDARDIASTVAALLMRQDVDGRDYDLTGGEALDHDQAAALLSTATGRAITYEEISPEAMRAGLLSAGLPADYVEFMLVILGYFKAGAAERITDAVPSLTGRAPRRFADYAMEHRAAWVA